MGVFEDIKTLISIQKINNGRTTKLSISQITKLIINLTDARNNLSANKYKQVSELYDKIRRICNTKMEMDIYVYYQAAEEIIKKFDAIAPYEKYCGEKNVKEEIDTQKELDAKSILQQFARQSNDNITLEDVKQFVSILPRYSGYGKDECLDAFDAFANQIIKKYDAITSITNVEFLLGVLNDNEVITQTELDSMRENYNNKFTKSILPNQYKKDCDEKNVKEEIDAQKEQYAKYIFQQLVQYSSNGNITLEDVKQFVNILPRYSGYGKDECLDAFDVFADQIIKKYDVMISILSVPFLLGVLNANKVITQTELDSMRETYNNKFMEKILSNQSQKDTKDEI